MKTKRSSSLRRWWWCQQFDPGMLGWMLTPFFFARRGLRKELTPLLAEFRGEVLDVGCGRMPYRSLVPATRYVGVDVDSPITRELGCADVFYDGRTLPFANETFDGVLCSQVLEHVFAPEHFLSELHRVLRPGGRLVLTVPFVWDEHEQPHDFARYSSFGLRSLLERSGFEMKSARKTCADFRVLVQLAAAYIFKVTRSRSLGLNLLAQLVLIAPVNLLGGFLALILPANPDLFLDSVVLAHCVKLPAAGHSPR